MQPRLMAPAEVAVQNLRAMASCSSRGCGHMSQHTVAAPCACSSSTAGSRCVGWVGASSCLSMIDLTGPASRRERTTPGPASGMNPMRDMT
jgi:hypothetical protein